MSSKNTPLYRAIRVTSLTVALFVPALLAACGGPNLTPTPTVDTSATVTAQVRDIATATAFEGNVQGYLIGKNATTTADTALFQSIKQTLKIQVKDAGPSTGTTKGTNVELTITNGDKAPHQIVVRLFDHNAPGNAQAYAVGALDLPAGATKTTTTVSPLPFASIDAQVLQIDGIWDSSPPVPR